MQLGKAHMEIKTKLFAYQAMFKVLSDEVSTKNPRSLRSIADESVIKTYESTGAKSYDAKINGEKVGTYSVRISKAKKNEKVQVTDERAYRTWAFENGLAQMTVDDELVIQHCHTTGEVPDGAEIVTEEVPEHVAGTTLKVEPEKVAHALKGELPTVIAGLLEGEN